MHDDSLFKRVNEPGGPGVTLHFEGAAIMAQPGDSVAAALLAAGHQVLRNTPVSGSARGPLCMMGVCFECLLEIDGQANRQGCMVPVREGMRIRRMGGARGLVDGADA